MCLGNSSVKKGVRSPCLYRRPVVDTEGPYYLEVSRNEHELFLRQTFRASTGYPVQKSRDIPPKSLMSLGFEGHIETFWPPRLSRRRPPLHRKIFGPESSGFGFCKSVWLPEVDTDFPCRVCIVNRGVDCRDPVCRHRFRFPDFRGFRLLSSGDGFQESSHGAMGEAMNS